MKNQKNKKAKLSLKRDRVESKTFHVGIELETFIPCDGGEREHDDDACRANYESSIRDDGAYDVLRNHLGLNRDEARSLEHYFDLDRYAEDCANDYCCDDDHCPYWSDSEGDGDSARDSLEESLIELTDNKSFKVVSDGSIKHDSNETDAEVCWNYFASKETLKDNAVILKHLVDNDAGFNKSCGLHINLNNYLNLELGEGEHIETEKLDFLFNFVAPSRRGNTYCSRFGLSGDEKYSMLYFQGDRVEFRFFSPTFDAEKLNHYVHLAHVVYKRLCGKKAKLSKKAMTYFLDKMIKVNGVSPEVAEQSIKLVNSLNSVSAHLYRGESVSTTLSYDQANLEMVGA